MVANWQHHNDSQRKLRLRFVSGSNNVACVNSPEEKTLPTARIRTCKPSLLKLLRRFDKDWISLAGNLKAFRKEILSKVQQQQQQQQQHQQQQQQQQRQKLMI